MVYQKVFYVIIILGLFSACRHSSGSSSQEKKVDFSTSDASELFFNNVRQIYYDLEEQENTKLKVYRIKTRSKDESHPAINLALVNNWRYDEAYLLIEPVGVLKQKNEIEIQWHSSNSEKSGSYAFKLRGSNKQEHVKFAGHIYESLRQNHQLHYLHRGESLPILHTPREKESFRVSIEDYYRLIGVL